jgi:hypothetical protein
MQANLSVRAESLRHDAFEAELAGVTEYDVAGFDNVLVELKHP